MKKPFAYRLSVLCLLWCLQAAAQPLESPMTSALRWHWSKPRGGGMDLLALTYGDGLWVAVGEGGMVLTSRDALTWEEQSTDRSETLDAVVWKPGCFLATGRDSILTSRDGIHWSSSKRKLMLPAASPTRFLAFAPEGRALWSEDGTTWHPSERPKGKSYRYLKWDGSSFLAGIDEDEWTSADGESWKRVESPDSRPRPVFGLRAESQRLYDPLSLKKKISETPSTPSWSLVSANEAHIIALTEFGRVFRSTDGLTWESPPSSHPYKPKAVQWADGRFVAVGEAGMIATSQDGLSWRLISGPEPGAVSRLASSDNTAVALLNNGSAIVVEDGQIITCSVPHAPAFGDINAFCHTPQGFVFHSGDSRHFPGAIAISNDGRQWTHVTRPPSKSPPEILAAAGSRLVALNSDGSILLSDDGIAWREGSEKTPWSLSCAASHRGKIIAAGSGKYNCFISTSEDGEAWETSVLNINARIKAITSNGTTCLMIAESGEVFWSDDLKTWPQCVLPAQAKIAAVAWSVNRFLAASKEGGFYTSPDGVQWTPTSLHGPRRIHSIVSRPGGGFIATDHFQLLESQDGRDWKPLDSSIITGGLMACAFNGQSFVAVGKGASATSADGVAWQTHRIEGSPELTDVCWGNNRWVATSTKDGFYFSSDGANWSKSLTAVPVEAMRTVVWTGEEFLAGGNAGLLYASRDGRLWRELPPRSVEAFLDLAVSDGQVLALMSGNVTLRRSVKQTGSWQTTPTGLPTELLRLNWDGNRFLAVGQDRVIYSSADGLNWKEETSTAGGTRAVASGGGWYATAGGFGTLALSQDLKQWSHQSLDDGMLLLDVCHGKGRFVAIGMLGQIVHSDVIPLAESNRENIPQGSSKPIQGRRKK